MVAIPVPSVLAPGVVSQRRAPAAPSHRRARTSAPARRAWWGRRTAGRRRRLGRWWRRWWRCREPHDGRGASKGGGERRGRWCGVAQHAPGVLRGEHDEPGMKADLVAQERRIGVVERRRHAAGDQDHEPHHQEKRDRQPVLDDFVEHRRRDGQDDAKEHRHAVQRAPLGRIGRPRVLHVVEREGWVAISQEEHVGPHPRVPPGHAAQEDVGPFGEVPHDRARRTSRSPPRRMRRCRRSPGR